MEFEDIVKNINEPETLDYLRTLTQEERQAIVDRMDEEIRQTKNLIRDLKKEEARMKILKILKRRG